MSDYRDLLEQERRRFRMPGGSMQDLERRRDRRRRNRRIASGMVALIVAAAGIGAGLYALRPTGTVKPVVSPTPTVTPSVSHGLLAPSGMVQFVDAKTGWAVKPNGQIVATVDGGKTWMVQHRGTVAIIGVQFIDELDGWAIDGDGLLQTVDGGSSWKRVSGQAFTTVQFVSAQIGWGISLASHGPPSTHLWMTPDGGETWFRREGAGLAADSVCALNEKVIWAAGTGQGGRGLVLAKSDDGGVSWVDTPIPVPQGEPWTATVRCAGIDAWVLVQDGGAAGHLSYALFHTAEGGPNALPVLQEAGTRPLGNVEGVVDAQDPYPGPIVAFNGVDALFVGWCPACGNSVALYGAGPGWTPPVEVVDQGWTPSGISFADRDHGWILLEHGGLGAGGFGWTVMATSDGGRTWSAATLG